MTCRTVSEWISHELDAEPTLLTRWRVGLHVRLCAGCRRYRRQVAAVDRAVAEFLGSVAGDPAVTMPTAVKEHLKLVIGRSLDDGA